MVKLIQRYNSQASPPSKPILETYFKYRNSIYTCVAKPRTRKKSEGHPFMFDRPLIKDVRNAVAFLRNGLLELMHGPSSKQD
mmetsp:Transcript_24994/g.60136  ORF Transcript_24994/g.60136 Transcript_24994/m.60136 type:complete len:82 (-) Transcript_24994:687-932(-)